MKPGRVLENCLSSTKGFVTLYKLPLRVMKRCIVGVREMSVDKRVYSKWSGVDISDL